VFREPGRLSAVVPRLAYVSAWAISLVVFAVVVGASACGVFLNRALPEHHLSEESKEIVRLGTGVIVTLTALVLGLLVASAKSSFDTKADEIRHSSVRLILIDRHLRQFGPEASGAREVLRRWVDDNAEGIWAPERRRFTTSQANAGWTAFNEVVRLLEPANDRQRALLTKVLDNADQFTQAHWLLDEEAATSIQPAFLAVLVAWLGIIFASFGLFAPRNGTVYAVIVLCALSLSMAIFLVLELDQPFEGAIRIPDAPLHILIKEIHR